MINRPPDYSRLFKVAGYVLKYYLLVLFLFAILCLLLAGLGKPEAVYVLLRVLGLPLLHLAILPFSLIAVAIVYESFR